jgi:two-component sensor histidine kinase
MLRLCIIICGVLLGTGRVSAFSNNNPLPDSIVRVMDSYFYESSKIDYLLNVVVREQFRTPPIAIAAANEAFLRAENNKNTQKEAEALYWISWLNFQHNLDGSLGHAASNINRSINRFRDLDDPAGLSKSLVLKAAIIFDSGDTTMARQNLEEAELIIPKIKRSRKDSLWVAGYLNLVKSNVFPAQNLELQLLSLKLFEQAGDSIRIGRICLKIAGSFTARLKPDSAIQYTQRAANAYRVAKFADGERLAFIQYLNALLYAYRINQEVSVFNQLVAHAQVNPQLLEEDYTLLSRIGVAYSYRAYFSKNYEEKKNWCDSANYYLNKAWKRVIRTQNIEEINLIYNNQKFNCELTNNCDSVFINSASAFLESLTISIKNNIQTQNELTEKYNSDRQRSLQEEKNKRNNLAMGSLAGLIILMLGFGYLHQRRNNEEMNRQLKSRMEALRAQMNPHFISNALNAIDSLVNQGRNKEASHYIIQFSRLCRVILNNSRHESVTLDEEIQMLTYFLNLEQLRMGDRLKYKMDIDPTLNIDQIAVPSMILQPFVENSIWHGIVSKPGGGTVWVQIKKRDDQTYQCIVEDDGIGREKSAELKAQMITRPSLGLAITEERIEKLHKIKGSHIVTEDLYDHNGKATGTRVTITLPIQNITEQQ